MDDVLVACDYLEEHGFVEQAGKIRALLALPPDLKNILLDLQYDHYTMLPVTRHIREISVSREVNDQLLDHAIATNALLGSGLAPPRDLLFRNIPITVSEKPLRRGYRFILSFSPIFRDRIEFTETQP